MHLRIKDRLRYNKIWRKNPRAAAVKALLTAEIAGDKMSLRVVA